MKKHRSIFVGVGILIAIAATASLTLMAKPTIVEELGTQAAQDIFIKNFEAPGIVKTIGNEKMINIGIANGGDTIPLRFDIGKIDELRQKGGLPIAIVSSPTVNPPSSTFQYKLVRVNEAELNKASDEGYVVDFLINSSTILMKKPR